MPLGMEVGLGPSDIVLDGDPAFLLKKGTQPPIFGPWSPISATADHLFSVLSAVIVTRVYCRMLSIIGIVNFIYAPLMCFLRNPPGKDEKQVTRHSFS